MKQHLNTKVLNEVLRLSASSCRKQTLYIYANPQCKRSYKKEVSMNLNVLFVTLYF